MNSRYVLKEKVAGLPDELHAEREGPRWLPGLWFKHLAGWCPVLIRGIIPGGK